MPTRSMTTISVLLLGVSLAATPAFAADAATSGNTGSGDAAVERAAPLTPPAGIKPKPMPTIDPSSLSRGIFDQDAEAAAASMGTETLNRDGSVSDQPASEGMRAILDEAMSGANPDNTVDRVVDATDDRTQVTDSSGYPDRVVGWLWMQDQKDQWFTCTGTLIGPYTVLTAAHCVYDHDTGGWIKQLAFLPGMVDAENAPFGQHDWQNINILKGYIDNYDGKNYGSVLPWDLAIIELQEDVGNQLGWLGFRVDDAADFKAELIGYPSDKPDGTMWDAKCDVPAANFGDQVFFHTCDTAGGTSGASMFETDAEGNIYVRGINVADDGKVNYSVRLIDSYYQFIIDNYK